MVGEFAIDIAFGIFTKFIQIFNIGNISWDVQSSAFTPFFDIVRSICYFLPVGTIGAIVGIVFTFGLFRIFIRFVKTVWDVLPFL